MEKDTPPPASTVAKRTGIGVTLRRRRTTRLVASCFVVMFLAPFLYKVIFLRYPVLSKPVENLWTLELKVRFKGTGKQDIIRHFLPGTERGQIVLREGFVSNRLSFVVTKGEGNTRVEWRGTGLKGENHVFYRATVRTRPRTAGPNTGNQQEKLPESALPDLSPVPEMESVSTEMQGLLDELVGGTRGKLERLETIYAFLTEDVATIPFSKHTDLIEPFRAKRATVDEKKRLLVKLCRMSSFPTRTVHGIWLDPGVRQRQIDTWAEVLLGGKWIPVDVENLFFAHLPADVLVLYRGDEPFIFSQTAKDVDYSYAVTREKQSTFSLFYATTARVGSRLHEWSLFSLPVETQKVFRLILLIPLGALVVSVYRNIIGLNTLGTFMPVLIALAFRNTKLGWGLALFAVVIVFGLLSRWFMDRLKLLLVPRLSVIVTVLVIMLAIGSLVGSHLGMYRILAVALFPMVIMTMTIERLSIILMERGTREAIQVSLGTLVVSTSGYLVMSIEAVQDFCFAFPETLFALIGIQILLGRYTGYRLTEYHRFHHFIREANRV